jgi:ferrous iron transport protein B
MIGHFIHPLLAPIGFNWQMAVALIPGMAAREVAISALGTVYAVGGAGDGALVSTLTSTLAHQWSLATALSFLVWYVFAPQCLSTLAVVKRETGGWFWPGVMFSYMLALAYTASFIVFRVATALIG